jgi:hypothetical protein
LRSTLLFKNLMRRPVTETAPEPGDQALAELAGKVDRAARARLGRSLAIREVDAGSCNACELEIHALGNPYYNIEGHGIRFVASPRHASPASERLPKAWAKNRLNRTRAWAYW